MQIAAIPMQFVAVTDGVRAGQEHVVLFLENALLEQPCGFALSLPDAHRLLAALRGVLPQAQQIQTRIRDSN
jgi:hypothetical protein